MSTNDALPTNLVIDVLEPGPFHLDIRLLEASGLTSPLLRASDDGCGSTCPTSCVSKLES